ncbi:hypothetical protein, partial [Actinoplanes siamensis]|uniref:hypothetical protein n=1 Tax=Actinoplanes siamensis TaxID=1223317 RepID=UPI00361D5EB5
MPILPDLKSGESGKKHFLRHSAPDLAEITADSGGRSILILADRRDRIPAVRNMQTLANREEISRGLAEGLE